MTIERWDLRTAAELLTALSPQQEAWAPNPSDWLFRGHGNSGWLLMPSAIRADARLGFGKESRRGRRATHEEQVEVEFQMLDEFLVSMNNHSHPLPPEVHSLWFGWADVHADVTRAATIGDIMWPLPRLLSLIALAQHHGVPTRLLDWSRSSRVAAFFAAERAATWVHDGFPPDGETSHLSVWAFREKAARPLWESASTGLQLIAVPQFQNANLRAQRGVFTVHTQLAARPSSPPTAQTVDQLVRENSRIAPTITQVCLRELTLPVQEAPRLLRLLSYEGVTSATLFPTLDGVVRELDEKRLWD